MTWSSYLGGEAMYARQYTRSAKQRRYCTNRAHNVYNAAPSLTGGSPGEHVDFIVRVNKHVSQDYGR